MKKHEHYNLTKNYSDENLFNAVFENEGMKVFCVIIAAILSLLISAAAYGIIWFERFGSDMKRIYTNKMVSSICWSILVW